VLLTRRNCRINGEPGVAIVLMQYARRHPHGPEFQRPTDARRSYLRPAFRVRSGLGQLLADRQRADTLARRRIDGVEKRGGDRRHAGFAYAAWRHLVAVRHDMHVSLARRLADAQHRLCRISAKIGGGVS
jgi:hypothetical protein